MKQIYTLFIAVVMSMVCANANAQGFFSYNKTYLYSDDWRIESYKEDMYSSSFDVKYNDTDNTAIVINYNRDGSVNRELHYTFNNRNQETLIVEYRPADNGVWAKKEILTYDDEGRILTYKNIYMYEGKERTHQINNYTYEDNLFILKLSYYDVPTGQAIGTYLSASKSEYDSEGNLTVFIAYDNVGTDENPIWKENYMEEYTYDEKGNEASVTYSNIDENGDRKLSEADFMEYQFTPEGYLAELKVTIQSSDGTKELEHVLTCTYTNEGEKLILSLVDHYDKDNQDYTTQMVFAKKPVADEINSVIVRSLNDRVYNLQGQPVNANHRGIQIKNGKKYIVK